MNASGKIFATSNSECRVDASLEILVSGSKTSQTQLNISTWMFILRNYISFSQEFKNSFKWKLIHSEKN